MKTDAPYSSSVTPVLGALLLMFLLVCQEARGAALDDHGTQQGHDDHGTQQGHDDHDAQQEHDEGLVPLSPEELMEFSIEVDPARPGTIIRMVEIPGEVQLHGERVAHIVPRFPGIVTAVHKKTGDTVRAGEVLAVVESSHSLASYELRTLIAGTVIERHITRGEAVTSERQAFVIANLTSVWVNLSVYQKDLSAVHVGQPVTLSMGHELPEAGGKISYVSPIVDEETRTATARVVLSNPHKRWRPGMFVTGRIVVERTKVPLAVPMTALQTIADQTVVFVETDEGFQPRAVTTGRADDDLVEIRTGLTPGERYVSRGGFTLKAELSREQFGDGHSH